MKRPPKALLAALLTAALLLSMSACDRPDDGSKSLYAHGLDVIDLMCEMANSDEYVSLYISSEEVSEIVKSAGSGDRSTPKAVYAISVNADSLTLLATMAEVNLNGMSSELRAFIAQRSMGALATQLNAMGGSNAIAATSICTASKTFVSADATESVIYLYTYENAAPAAVTFTVGENHAVTASGVFIAGDDFKCGSADEIKASFSYMDVEVTEVAMK